MENFHTTTIIAAIGMMISLGACSMSDQIVPELCVEETISETLGGIAVSFSDDNNTKTFLDGTTEKWSVGEQIGIYAKNGREFDNYLYSIQTGEGEKTATFSNPDILWAPNVVYSDTTRTSIVSQHNPYNFYTYYPYNANIDTLNTSYTNVPVSLDANQFQSAPNNSDHFGSYKLAYAFIGEAHIEGVEIGAGQWEGLEDQSNHINGFMFTPLVSVFKFAPLNMDADDAVTSITMSTTQDAALAFSNAHLDLSHSNPSIGGQILYIDDQGEQSVTLNIGGEGLRNKEFGYMFVNTVAAGTVLDVTFTTKNGKTYQRPSVTLASDLKAGTMYVTALSMKSCTDITSATNLSARGMANCYVAGRPTEEEGRLSYSFDCQFEGNSTDIVGTTAQMSDKEIYSAQLIWGKTRIDASSVALSADRKTVTFDAIYCANNAGNGNGNAVIAVRNQGGQILWSWHIWVTEYNPYTSNLVAGGHTFMDRNLGADLAGNINNESIGVFYQWGRKDPLLYGGDKFAKSQVGAGDAANLPRLSVLNPSLLYCVSKTNTTSVEAWSGTNGTESWGVEKTKYDPCPAGWRVPEDGAMDFLKEGSSMGDNCLTNGDFVLYAAGSIDPKGAFSTHNNRGYYWSCNAYTGTLNNSSTTALNGSTAYYTYFNTVNKDVKTSNNCSVNNNLLNGAHSCASALPVRCIAE